MAIGLSIGDNGIIKQAQDAADRWKEGSQKEQNALGDLAYFINSNTRRRTRATGTRIKCYSESSRKFIYNKSRYGK